MRVQLYSTLNNFNLSILFSLLFTSYFSYSQSPGGIGTTNLTSWFKADGLTAGNVTSWTTTFPTGASAITLADAAAPYPTATNTPTNSTSNYNMTLDFTGNSINMSLENTNAFNLLDNNNSGNEGTMFLSFYSELNDPNGHLLLYNENSGNGDGIQLRQLTTTTKLALGKKASNSTFATRDRTIDTTPKIISYKGNRSGSTSMTSMENNMTYTGGTASQSSGPRGIYIGTKPSIGNSSYTGFYNELITFNTDLSATQMTQVNTYLGIKFGITLDNTGGGDQGDYIATSGIQIWDASLNSNYHNNIIGIGKDNDEALHQKQSHTFYDSTRLYVDLLANNNSSNNGIIGNNIAYLLMGDNTGKMCATASSNQEIPGNCSLTSRLEREWKVTKTNFDQNCSMDFNIGGCGNPTNVDVSHLKLLVDDDGDFSNGGTTCYANGDAGLVISYSNPVITVKNISDTHLPNDSTLFITIASINSTTPLPVKLTTFSVKPTGFLTATAEWTTQSETNNDYFIVEKSINGIDWDFVSEINGAGNSSTTINYEVDDNRCHNGLSYYRLKQVDFNGDLSYSDIKTLNFDNIHDIRVYPNPASNKLIISGYSGNNADCIIYNAYGQNVSSRISLKTQNENEIILNISGLSNGIYLIKFKSFSRKIQILH